MSDDFETSFSTEYWYTMEDYWVGDNKIFLNDEFTLRSSFQGGKGCRTRWRCLLRFKPLNPEFLLEHDDGNIVWLTGDVEAWATTPFTAHRSIHCQWFGVRPFGGVVNTFEKRLHPSIPLEGWINKPTPLHTEKIVSFLAHELRRYACWYAIAHLQEIEYNKLFRSMYYVKD